MTYRLPETISVDGFGRVVRENGVIKIDAIVMTDHSAGPGMQAQKLPCTTHRLVLSEAGFKQALQTLKAMEEALAKGEADTSAHGAREASQ